METDPSGAVGDVDNVVIVGDLPEHSDDKSQTQQTGKFIPINRRTSCKMLDSPVMDVLERRWNYLKYHRTTGEFQNAFQEGEKEIARVICVVIDGESRRCME